MSLTLLFPGQGSQSVGMGRDLFDAFPEARAVFEEADEVLGFRLSHLIFDGPEDRLTATKNAQPALLTHSVASLRVLAPRIGPVASAAGHSLGEFSAHVAAGTLSFADALSAVRRRGELMYDTGRRRPGTMAAILGLDDDQVADVCRRVGAGVCVPANFNAPGQVVISGDEAAVAEAIDGARAAGAKRALALEVSGAFHSPLMAPAEDELAEHLAGIEFRNPDFPVYANVTAAPVTSGAEARRLLVRQLTAPVRWSATVRAMADGGTDRFIEVGPGGVLRGLTRRIAKGVPCESAGTVADLEKLEAAA
jgi:[acyl-carrier-protein] S-malonyltransferase